MFRTTIDQLMDGKIAPVLIVLAHACALLWALMGRGIKPALIVNLVLAAGIVAYHLPTLGPAIFQDDAILLLVVLELATLAASIGALCGMRIPPWIVWTAFGINLLLAIALTAFLLTFKMRLF